MKKEIKILGPDKDPEYWQTYGVVIKDKYKTLHNLRVKHWPNLVDKEGLVYTIFNTGDASGH